MLRSTGLIRKSIYSQEQPDAMEQARARARAQGKITKITLSLTLMGQSANLLPDEASIERLKDAATRLSRRQGWPGTTVKSTLRTEYMHERNRRMAHTAARES